jgi:hypothetical protein
MTRLLALALLLLISACAGRTAVPSIPVAQATGDPALLDPSVRPLSQEVEESGR